MWPSTPGDPTGEGWYQRVIPYYAHVPACSTFPCADVPHPTSPEEYVYGPTNFLKIGYTRPLGHNTSWNTFFYNWGGLVANNVTGSSPS